MIGIVDYGVGNLFSLKSSFYAIGQTALVSDDPAVLGACDRLILPGVGAFGDASEKLRASGLDRLVCRQAEQGVPLLGICLGMQMLFEESLEHGRYKGLGLLKGQVCPIVPKDPAVHKIPHIGWNGLHVTQPSLLFAEVREGDDVYFVHSYSARDCADSVIATVEYGEELTAAVAQGNVYGTQFHPEKSGPVGLSILKAFCQF